VTPDQLLRRADAAMYRAKERGRDQYDVFDTDLRDRTEARQELVQAIRDGLRQDRVALVFQPVVDVDSNLIVGAEALVRLSNAAGRLLPTLPASQPRPRGSSRLSATGSCTWPLRPPVPGPRT
jgi:predicted signal transduction protein with EAL and GGDEF domain